MAASIRWNRPLFPLALVLLVLALLLQSFSTAEDEPGEEESAMMDVHLLLRLLGAKIACAGFFSIRVAMRENDVLLFQSIPTCQCRLSLIARYTRHGNA